MLSHQVGAGLITDARLLTETRNELAIQRRDARQEARRTKAALAQRDRRIAHSEERLSRSAASDAALTETQEKIALLESGAELRRLRDRIASLEGELFAAKRSENCARREAGVLREERAASQTGLEQTSVLISDYEAACGVMERLFANGTQDSPTSEQCSDCPDLAGRRVLCLRGRSSISQPLPLSSQSLQRRVRPPRRRHRGQPSASRIPTRCRGRSHLSRKLRQPRRLSARETLLQTQRQGIRASQERRRRLLRPGPGASRDLSFWSNHGLLILFSSGRCSKASNAISRHVCCMDGAYRGSMARRPAYPTRTMPSPRSARRPKAPRFRWRASRACMTPSIIW